MPVGVSFAWPATGNSCKDIGSELFGKVGVFGWIGPEHRGSDAIELVVGAVANSQSRSAAILSPASARWSLLLPSVERFLASAHPISDAASARASAIVCGTTRCMRVVCDGRDHSRSTGRR